MSGPESLVPTCIERDSQAFVVPVNGGTEPLPHGDVRDIAVGYIAHTRPSNNHSDQTVNFVESRYESARVVDQMQMFDC